MIDNTRPAYRVLDPNGFYSDNDTLYQEGDEIYFEGEPNDQLEPLNQIAKDKLNNYLDKLDEQAKEDLVDAKGKVIVKRHDVITKDTAKKLKELDWEKIPVRHRDKGELPWKRMRQN